MFSINKAPSMYTENLATKPQHIMSWALKEGRF